MLGFSGSSSVTHGETCACQIEVIRSSTFLSFVRLNFRRVCDADAAWPGTKKLPWSDSPACSRKEQSPCRRSWTRTVAIVR